MDEWGKKKENPHGRVNFLSKSVTHRSVPVSESVFESAVSSKPKPPFQRAATPNSELK